MSHMEPYHETEIALQTRLGRRSLAEMLAPRIWREIADEVREFLPTLPFAIIGSLDEIGRPWASILSGKPGFLEPETKTLRDLGNSPLFRSLAIGSRRISRPCHDRHRLRQTSTI